MSFEHLINMCVGIFIAHINTVVQQDFNADQVFFQLKVLLQILNLSVQQKLRILEEFFNRSRVQMIGRLSPLSPNLHQREIELYLGLWINFLKGWLIS